MKYITPICVSFLMLSCAAPLKPAETPPTINAPVEPFIQNMHQITFDGKRAGEGYFSHDGRYMVFQSEREPENPFYQIYVTDLKNGETHRVSPGEGKTSCAWIAPDNKHILFASTHLDADLKKKAAIEYEERKNPKRYAWNFDPAFDIFVGDFQGKHLKNLTRSPGYDAEGSFSPDGKLIAFASNRAAYTEKLSEEQNKLFARDPSSMMDIYIMNADGTNVRRLTDTPGYDGGPFFSPDGRRLTFRRFNGEGNKAEIYTMNIDGSDQKQITHLGVMSWAPFYHPSGDYLIFTSNKLGFQNFELFIVDTAGLHDPVRVTDLSGFDGLPVFTPDGHSLVWTHTNAKGESQLYRADWNDTLARKALKLAPPDPSAKSTTKEWIEYLASEKLGGRPTGGAEEREYMRTLARAFKELGLEPVGGPELLHEYEFTAGVDLGAKNWAKLESGKIQSELILGRDWMPYSFSQTGEAAKGALVFAGYGIVAPASGTESAYDAYGALDVKGKWVVVFSGLPNDVSNERRYFLNSYAQVQFKATMARQRGAAGLIVIGDASSPQASMKLIYEGPSDQAGIPVLKFSGAIAEAMFRAAGTSLSEWTKRLARGETGQLDIPQTKLTAFIDLKIRKGKALNLVGELRVPHAHQAVMIGAHGDHLGHGEQGHSLAPDSHAVHPGADDNASGVAGVLAIARDLKPAGLKQNVIFAVWSGEELGDLGSSAFLNNNPPKISAYLNMDMIGRYRDQLAVQGLGSAPQWKTLVEEVNTAHPLRITTQDDPYLPTDALMFYLKKIPVLSFFTGAHSQYHSPNDTADLINVAGLESIANWVEAMAVKLASQTSSMVRYQKVETIHNPTTSGRGFRLYLGTIPDYTQESQVGVVISGTRKNSPAEKAGLQAGDIIVELGGMKIKNLYDYMYCLQALKANEKIQMHIERGGEAKTLEITPVQKTQAE